jgi:hypothetical protein
MPCIYQLYHLINRIVNPFETSSYQECDFCFINTDCKTFVIIEQNIFKRCNRFHFLDLQNNIIHSTVM